MQQAEEGYLFFMWHEFEEAMFQSAL